jgi:hypothetical protein
MDRPEGQIVIDPYEDDPINVNSETAWNPSIFANRRNWNDVWEDEEYLQPGTRLVETNRNGKKKTWRERLRRLVQRTLQED